MNDKAKLICRLAHVLQDDKCGKPYWTHPYKVAETVGEKEKDAAYLHDVLEDTHLTADDLLRYGITRETVGAVRLLTRQKGEPYAEYLDRLSSNEIAKAVKMADLKHNLDPTRDGATESMRARYRKALERLEGDGA